MGNKTLDAARAARLDEFHTRYGDALAGLEPFRDRLAGADILLDGDERRLSIRAFDKRTQRAAYETQGHRCAVCGGEFGLADMHADHIVPWSRGGHTVPDNCQMLCRDCNLKKGAQA